MGHTRAEFEEAVTKIEAEGWVFVAEMSLREKDTVMPDGRIPYATPTLVFRRLLQPGGGEQD